MSGVVGLLPHYIIFRYGVACRSRVVARSISSPILLVTTHLGVTRVLTRHEASARGSTHGATGIGLGEAHTLLGHAVKVGRTDVLLPVTTHVRIAEVVTHDVDDVGFLLILCLQGIHAWSNRKATSEKKQLLVVHSVYIFVGYLFKKKNSLMAPYAPTRILLCKSSKK